MPDVFGYNRPATVTQVFSNENSLLQFSSNGAAKDAKGYLVQNWQINYSQELQEIFELGSNNIYWVKGRPQGGGQFGRVVGAKGSAKEFFDPKAFNICDGGANMTLTVSSGSCGPGENKVLRLAMTSVVVQSLAYSANVGDTRVGEAIQFRFASLSV